MKTEYKGFPFNGTMAEFVDFVKMVDSGILGKSKPTASGKGNGSGRVVLTPEEREQKKAERNAQHKAEQKAWFESLSETEQKEFIAKKEEQRAKRTYMQAISASKLNVQMAIDKMPKSKKDANGRVSREVYVTLFKAEMKKYGFDWEPKDK